MNDAGPILIRNCRLFDGMSETTREGVNVLIRHGRIERFDRKVRPPAGAAIIEATGQTLLPGLIDTHVHLTFDGSGDPIGHLLARSGYASLLVAVHSARQHLRRGVTTVRDLGSPAGLVLELHRAIQQGLVPGPFIVASDRVITTTGGHCHFMGLEVDDRSEMRRAVRMLVKYGADVIKIMATGGALTPRSSVLHTQYSLDEMIPVVEEAHSQGLKVAAHANGLEGLRNAVAAGVDSIEHGSYADREVIELMAKKGTWWVPTMAPARLILENHPGDVSPERLASVNRNWQARREAVLYGLERGVKMAAGTDAGVTYTGHGLVSLEIETFHQLGMPAWQAIHTATSTAADLLGLGDRIGSITEGKQADLILVEGDPLADLSLLAAPRTVIKAGVVVGAEQETIQGGER